jgi:hydrogenase maturation protease
LTRPVTDPNLTDRSPRCVIIGYGNPLRGDDRAGFSVADYLHHSGSLPPQVTAIAVHQLVPELAELLSQTDQVIFVDAELREPSEPLDQSGGAVHPEPTDPGLSVRSLTLRSSTAPLSFDPHRSSPEGLLDLAVSLYDRAPSVAWLLGIPAVDFGFGDQLSPLTQAGIAQAIDWIMAQLNRTIAHPPTPEPPCMN